MKKFDYNKFLKYFFIVVFSCYLIFSFFAYSYTDREVDNKRETNDSLMIQDYNYERITDPYAPASVKDHYRFSIDKRIDNDKNISFYLIHQTARVYIAGDLVYESKVPEDNLFGKSVGSYWANVSLTAEDTGKLIDIYVIPLYEETKDLQLEILYGSTFAIFLKQISMNLLPLIFAIINIFVGFAVIVGQIAFYRKRDVNHLDNIYLAIMSIIMGFWKLSDNTISYIIFPKSAGLNFISQAIIIFGSAPILLYVRSQFRHTNTKLLDAVTTLSLLTSASCLALQVFNILDLRETLVCGHILIIISIIAVIITTIRNLDYINNSFNLRRRFLFSVVIAIGVFIDLIVYYIHGSTNYVFLSLFALSSYSIYTFFSTTIADRHNAYTDLATGLSNKSKWDLLTKEELSSEVRNAIIVLDLNGLKQINDSYGHDAGDVLIRAFANIIRRNVKMRDTVCRWGGDEFVIIIQNAKQETIDSYIRNIDIDVKNYNKADVIKISFAAGYAISEVGQKTNLKDLLHIADKDMYNDKSKWYQANSDSNTKNI